MLKRWKRKNIDISHLQKEPSLSGISALTLEILVNRGFDTTEKINQFLYGNIYELLDTRDMKDAEKATTLIMNAIEKNIFIVVYGDYDSDGVHSTAVMVELLRKAGAEVGYYTNDRFKQGYGMMESGVDEILSMYPKTGMIITVDNGIMAHDGIDYALGKELQVIVTDHHEPGATLPNAHAIVDPKRKDDTYAFKELCGAGVAFKLMMLLYYEMGLDMEIVYDTLDMVAVATVGDIVSLQGENRILVQEGLKRIKEEKRPVYRMFREITEVKEIASWTLGFVYVPMVNAIGRLDGNPRRAIEMYVDSTEEEAIETIKYLKEVNSLRKSMTVTQCERAEEIVQSKGLQKVIVVYDESFHEGIVGLIAGRLKEKYNRPVFAFTNHGESLKGSARSIDGYHLKQVFEEVENLILGGGGHAKAGGLSVEKEKLEVFEKAILEIADRKLTDDDFVKTYHIDAHLDAQTISMDVLDELSALEPFGEGFNKPVLLLNNFEGKLRYMGDNQQHVKLTGDTLSIVMWNQGDEYRAKGAPTRIRGVGYPELNTYAGNVSLQFKIENMNLKPI